MATAASFYVSSTTHNSATIRVELGDGYSKFRIFCRTAGGATAKDTTLTRTADFNYTISGLSSSTDYAVNVCSIPASGQGGEWAVAEDFTTDSAPAPTRPTNWEWWSDVRAGQPIAFTDAEFQAFYDKIDAFRIYRGVSAWPNFIPVSRGTPISADIVNEARAAIAEITTAALPPTARGGEPITASYFNALKDYLNSVT